MTLEELKERSSQLAVNIAQQTNQVFVLQGHKNEVDYQILIEEKKLEDFLASDEDEAVE